MSDGFLGRWARRKLEVKQEELARQSRQQIESPVVEKTVSEPHSLEGQPAAAASLVQEASPQAPPVVLPTEADLDAVVQGGEIRNFMNPQVSGDLRNKAFKALFSQPQFNQMDFMDVYVDDYSVSTPLTAAMIDMMALGKQLLSRPDLEPPFTADQSIGLADSIHPVDGPVESSLECQTPEGIQAGEDAETRLSSDVAIDLPQENPKDPV